MSLTGSNRIEKCPKGQKSISERCKLMEIKRDLYLNQLIERKQNGLIKVITGIRRCGKSYLLNTLFHDYLKNSGVDENHIIKFAFDSSVDLKSIGENIVTLEKEKRKVNPDKFMTYIQSKMTDKETYYLLLDEVQLLDCFVRTNPPIITSIRQSRHCAKYPLNRPIRRLFRKTTAATERDKEYRKRLRRVAVAETRSIYFLSLGFSDLRCSDSSSLMLLSGVGKFSGMEPPSPAMVSLTAFPTW